MQECKRLTAIFCWRQASRALKRTMRAIGNIYEHRAGYSEQRPAPQPASDKAALTPQTEPYSARRRADGCFLSQKKISQRKTDMLGEASE